MRTSDTIKNQSTLNLFDKEIFDSKHDEIVMWLYEKLKNKKFKDVGLNFLKHFSEEDIEKMNTVVKIEEAIQSKASSYSSPKVIGFADLTCWFNFLPIKKTVKRINYGKEIEEEIEEDRRIFLCFEIKTKLNIGETVRQINYYKANSYGFQSWFVCAPPSPGAEILKDQDIGFIKYEPNT